MILWGSVWLVTRSAKLWNVHELVGGKTVLLPSCTVIELPTEMVIMPITSSITFMTTKGAIDNNGAPKLHLFQFA